MITIAHAAALTEEDRIPFEHGVALARSARARLYSLHANDDPESRSRMPDAADVLTRWGAPHTPIDHEKLVHNCCEDPVDTVLDALHEIRPDLVIAATHQRDGIWRILFGSRAEAIAGNVVVPTLLLPIGAEGFVGRDTGDIDLHRVLVPVGDREAAEAAVAGAAWLVALAGARDVELLLLHVGPPDERPQLSVAHQGLHPRWKNVEGKDLDDAILEEAEDACVIVMASRGHDSIGDVVLGSHTDRVLHRAKCPVLNVPVGGSELPVLDPAS